MFKRTSLSYHHVVSHMELAIMWSVMVLKTNNYWIHSGGSEFLPQAWIYLLHKTDHTFQTWLALLGLVCSLQCILICKNRINVLWNMAAGLLWIMMIAASLPLEKMSLALILCVVGSARTICRLNPVTKSNKSDKVLVDKIKSPQSANQHNSSTDSNLLNSTPSVPGDLDLSRLDIGTPGVKCEAPSSTHTRRIVPRSPGFTKPKPVISPSRFSPSSISSSPGNLTKASWVAGGYWQNNGWGSPASLSSPSPTYANTVLTRSSSQSSGFGSVQTGLFNRSPPDSRPDSTLEEIDRLSVYSDNLESRFAEPSSLHQYHPESPPIAYSNLSRNNDLSRKSLMSSISSINGSFEHASSSPLPPPLPMSQWSWLPFLFGFSLAVNMCVLIYCVFLHSTKT